MIDADKITAQHLQRHAYVYVRQSSTKQVHENRESQHNQYALTERAMTLGWIEERVHVIDVDQGQSGQDGSRSGFQELVAEVSLGRVGIVLAYEASRLARNNADWYTLLDLATVVGTLIADTDGVYDPRTYNDRLLLGLRGMLSEAELHLLRLRMDAGRMRQVERGTYRQHIPTGLVRLPDGRVIKDPNEQVQHAIALVFEHFVQLGSAQRVLRRLREDGVLLPRHQTSGFHAGQLVWKKPTESMIYDMLHNPAYAGAFAYGRHGPAPDRRPGQRSQVRRPMEEWLALQHDVYPAYIRWEQYMTQQERLAENASRFAERARGAPRSGVALLAGLVVCGRCGHQMRVVYKPRVRYACSALRKSHDGDTCLYLEGTSIDEVVVQAFFEALQPAELDLLDAVLARQESDRARRVQQVQDQVKQAEYDARLSQRQYHAVDPDNRLVAAELERRWELALRALADARETAERVAQETAMPPLEPSMRTYLRDVGRRLPELWSSGCITPEQQKELLRSLIRRVVLTRPEHDCIRIKVIWVSGAVSELSIHPPIWRSVDLSTYPTFIERVLALTAEGWQDAAIADKLTEEGFRSARSPRVPVTLVRRARHKHGGVSLFEQYRTLPKIDDQWTVLGLSRELGVHRNWLYHRLAAGTLTATRHPQTRHYLIPDDPDLLTALRAQIPEKRLT